MSFTSFLQYIREIHRSLSDIARQTGHSFPQMAFSFTRCFLARHVQIEEFRTLRLYNCTRLQLSRYMTYYESIKYSDKLNAGATKEDIATFNDKHLFNTAFCDFIHRDWLYLPDSTPEEVAAFMARNKQFLVKACVSTQGKNISLCSSADTDPEALFREHQDAPYILEALIRQHPALSAVNPSSVNSIRFVAAKKGDAVRFIGAGLRCGGSGQFVDNFHHGGAAYPIDLEGGFITGPGITLTGSDIVRHPTSGHIMPGLVIPHWETLLETVRRAAMLNPRIGYVGWDLAVTEDGIELIEGNINYPGTTTIQLDGPGALERIRSLMNS